VLDGNTLYGNYAATNHIGSRGGGVFVGFWNAAPSSSTVSTTIRNSIVWGNTAHADPGIVFNSMGTFTIDYTDTQESWGGTGNLVANPFFVDAANGDLNLQATSPCIDAGDPASPLDPDGTRADMGALPFQQCLPPTTYCTAKTNSQGCVPAVGSSGSPSATSSSPFTITATNVLNQKSGLLFYGFGSNAAPFQGGTMCVQPPVRRTPLQSSNGNAPPDDCSGSYAADFNAWTQSSSDPLLIAGAHVFVQFWSRDPASPSTTGLTDALSFWICQ
jgi:hypothetical protein